MLSSLGLSFLFPRFEFHLSLCSWVFFAGFFVSPQLLNIGVPHASVQDPFSFSYNTVLWDHLTHSSVHYRPRVSQNIAFSSVFFWAQDSQYQLLCDMFTWAQGLPYRLEEKPLQHPPPPTTMGITSSNAQNNLGDWRLPLQVDARRTMQFWEEMMMTLRIKGECFPPQCNSIFFLCWIWC